MESANDSRTEVQETTDTLNKISIKEQNIIYDATLPEQKKTCDQCETTMKIDNYQVKFYYIYVEILRCDYSITLIFSLLLNVQDVLEHSTYVQNVLPLKKYYKNWNIKIYTHMM